MSPHISHPLGGISTLWDLHSVGFQSSSSQTASTSRCFSLAASASCLTPCTTVSMSLRTLRALSLSSFVSLRLSMRQGRNGGGDAAGSVTLSGWGRGGWGRVGGVELGWGCIGWVGVAHLLVINRLAVLPVARGRYIAGLLHA